MKTQNNIAEAEFKFYPLTTESWKDFEKLFGERGACGGCWCMTWRQKSSDFEKNKGEKNRKRMKQLVEKNEQVGIIAYAGKEPVGWCSFAPRDKFIRLENSRVLQKLDDKPVWSITCFFIAKEYRRKGLSSELLKAVIKYCEKKKVKILEGYPVVPYDDKIPAAFAWTGMPSAFEKAGFREAARRSESRPIYRFTISSK